MKTSDQKTEFVENAHYFNFTTYEDQSEFTLFVVLLFGIYLPLSAFYYKDMALINVVTSMTITIAGILKLISPPIVQTSFELFPNRRQKMLLSLRLLFLFEFSVLIVGTLESLAIGAAMGKTPAWSHLIASVTLSPTISCLSAYFLLPHLLKNRRLAQIIFTFLLLVECYSFLDNCFGIGFIMIIFGVILKAEGVQTRNNSGNNESALSEIRVLPKTHFNNSTPFKTYMRWSLAQSIRHFPRSLICFPHDNSSKWVAQRFRCRALPFYLARRIFTTHIIVTTIATLVLIVISLTPMLFNFTIQFINSNFFNPLLLAWLLITTPRVNSLASIDDKCVWIKASLDFTFFVWLFCYGTFFLKPQSTFALILTIGLIPVYCLLARSYTNRLRSIWFSIDIN